MGRGSDKGFVMAKSNQLRIQSRRQVTARKKSATGFAKGKVFKGPAPRKLKIRA